MPNCNWKKTQWSVATEHVLQQQCQAENWRGKSNLQDEKYENCEEIVEIFKRKKKKDFA